MTCCILVNVIERFLTTVWQLQTTPVILAYFALVFLGAPAWKRLSKPLEIPASFLIAHNIICVFLSLYCCISLPIVLSTGDIFSLEAGDPLLSNVLFVYWVSKHIELLDTVLMILRHRFRQLTFLHVFHHSTMALLSDYAYHYSPWPSLAFPLGMNAVVHVVLYSYYGWSVWKPQTTISWKKHITEMQILQFFIGLIHTTIGYKYHGFCIYGPMYGVCMVLLFGNFYVRAYTMKKPTMDGRVKKKD